MSLGCLHFSAKQFVAVKSFVIFCVSPSGTFREEGAVGSTVPYLATSAGGGVQVEDDIRDLDETQVQEPVSKRQKEGNAAQDLLEALTSKMMQDAALRDQHMAERVAERDAVEAAVLFARDAALAEKPEGLVKADSESVDTKIRNLSACVDGKMDNLERWEREQWKTFENKWTEKIVHKEAVITQAEFQTPYWLRSPDACFSNRQLPQPFLRSFLALPNAVLRIAFVVILSSFSMRVFHLSSASFCTATRMENEDKITTNAIGGTAFGCD